MWFGSIHSVLIYLYGSLCKLQKHRVASLNVLLLLAFARTHARAHACVCVYTCVCEPDRVMWEEIVSLPYLGKASTPGDKASFHKAQLITLNISDVRKLASELVLGIHCVKEHNEAHTCKKTSKELNL